MAVLVLILGAVLAACSSSGDSTASASSRLGGSGTETTRLGASLYTRHCAECHGGDGDRLPIAPLNVKTFLDSRGDATLLAVVAEGKGTMPAYGRNRGGPLDDNEVRAVVAYLNAQAGRTSTTLLAGQGERLYTSLCASCHGENGDRIPVVPLDAKGFLDSRTDAEMVNVVLNGKNASPAFGAASSGRKPITEQDATAIVSFLRYRVQAITVRSVGLGRDLYVGNCLACHGTSGDRTPNVQLADAAYLLQLGDGRIISAINNGTDSSPAFGSSNGGGFAVTDTAALLAYLKSWAGLNATAALTLPGGGGKGEALYMTTCAACHGPTGDQVPGVQLRSGTFLSSRGKPVVRETISVGNDKGMPAWCQASGGPLSDEQIDSIIAFLFSSAGVGDGVTAGGASASGGGGGGGSEALAPIFDGKTAKEFFADKCAACHGAERQGLVGPALLPERLTEPDDFYFKTIAEGRSGTPMPSWRSQGVTDEQIRALVAFIKSDPNAAAAAPSGGGEVLAPIFDGKTAKEFFADKCAACHGADRQGVIGPALLPERLTEPDDFYFKTIAEGRSGTPMPSWRSQGVTDEQIRALVSFIKSDPNAAAANPPSSGGGGGGSGADAAIFDGKTAKEFFAARCAACHGADRQGVIGPALLPERLTEPDDFYFKTIAEGRAGTPMPSWRSQGVTDEQIRALVAFIKSDPKGSGATSAAPPAPAAKASLAMAFLPVGYERMGGAELFANVCSKCHGTDGLSVKPCPLGSREWISNMSEEGLVTRIARGKPSMGMPTWSELYGGPLTDQQVRSIAKYVSQMAK